MQTVRQASTSVLPPPLLPELWIPLPDGWSRTSSRSLHTLQTAAQRSVGTVLSLPSKTVMPSRRSGIAVHRQDTTILPAPPTPRHLLLPAGTIKKASRQATTAVSSAITGMRAMSVRVLLDAARRSMIQPAMHGTGWIPTQTAKWLSARMSTSHTPFRGRMRSANGYATTNTAT